MDQAEPDVKPAAPRTHRGILRSWILRGLPVRYAVRAVPQAQAPASFG